MLSWIFLTLAFSTSNANTEKTTVSDQRNEISTVTLTASLVQTTLPQATRKLQNATKIDEFTIESNLTILIPSATDGDPTTYATVNNGTRTISNREIAKLLETILSAQDRSNAILVSITQEDDGAVAFEMEERNKRLSTEAELERARYGKLSIIALVVCVTFAVLAALKLRDWCTADLRYVKRQEQKAEQTSATMAFYDMTRLYTALPTSNTTAGDKNEIEIHIESNCNEKDDDSGAADSLSSFSTINELDGTENLSRISSTSSLKKLISRKRSASLQPRTNDNGDNLNSSSEDITCSPQQPPMPASPQRHAQPRSVSHLNDMQRTRNASLTVATSLTVKPRRYRKNSNPLPKINVTDQHCDSDERASSADSRTQPPQFEAAAGTLSKSTPNSPPQRLKPVGITQSQIDSMRFTPPRSPRLYKKHGETPTAKQLLPPPPDARRRVSEPSIAETLIEVDEESGTLTRQDKTKARSIGGSVSQYGFGPSPTMRSDSGIRLDSDQSSS